MMQFFDLLFTPNRREQLGSSREERRENARVLAIKLMPLIRKAARPPRFAAYTPEPTPRIAIVDPSGPESSGRVTVSLHEDKHNLMWLISGWE